MQIYRGDDAEAMKLFRRLGELGIPAQLERYGSAIYVVVNTTRPDIPELARSLGRTIRPVHPLDQLPRPGRQAADSQ